MVVAAPWIIPAAPSIVIPVVVGIVVVVSIALIGERVTKDSDSCSTCNGSSRIHGLAGISVSIISGLATHAREGKRRNQCERDYFFHGI